MKSFSAKIPGLGLVGLVYDKQGESTWFPGGLAYQSHLMARHMDREGNLIKEHDCGSGLVTFLGVQALAADYLLPSVSAAKVSTLTLANYHISGTGAVAAATTDIRMGTPATVLASTLPQIGTQGTGWSASDTTTTNIYYTTCTLTYNGSAAITEWGLLTGNQNAITPPTTGTPIASTTAGTPGTPGVAATGTGTGSVWTASTTTARGQSLMVLDLAAATTPCHMLVTSNTTNVATGPNWKITSSGATTVPAGTLSLALRDVLFDRKVFSAINVVNLDSIQFSYSLTVTSGG